jgi:hypothetical protein
MRLRRNKLMQKRHLSIVILIGAILLGMWGNAIAASFCPHFALNRDCHPKQVSSQPKQIVHQPSCHKEMGDSEMREMPMEAASDSEPDADVEASPVAFTSEGKSDQLAWEPPSQPCSHCLSHSHTASGAVTSAVAVDPSKRLIETSSPPVKLAALTLSAFPTIVPMEHGPPGESRARHVLISVFLI